LSSINTSLSSQITPPFAPIWSSKSPYLQAAALPYLAYFIVPVLALPICDHPRKSAQKMVDWG
jgi:hypothetical protein